jgi:tetratricopeptide (TPR) repeat protein
VLAGGIAVVAAWLYWTMGSPIPDYWRAQKLLSKDPTLCEQYAERAVVKSGGNFPAAQLLQCRALAATGEWDAALGGFYLIKDLAACPIDSLLSLGEAALEADQLQLADRTLSAARRPGKPDARTAQLLVRLKLKLQLRDQVLPLCREWQAADPQAALPWAIAAEIEVAQFDLGSAIADFREALRRSAPGELEQSLRASLANLLVQTGEVSEARTHFDILLKSGPLPEKLRLDYAQLLRMEGKTEQALQEVERYLKDHPRHIEALKRRGLILMDLGRWEEALSDLRRALVENEADSSTHHLLAQVYRRMNEPELAQRHLQRSRELMDVTARVSELEEQLRQDPTNAALLRELKELRKSMSH